MNRLINKILKEAEEMDDPFFKPKIQKREEEIIKRDSIFLLKTKIGLRNIKKDYKNKKWDSKEEELFLKIFFALHSKKDELFKSSTYVDLRNSKDVLYLYFTLETESFYVSYSRIWKIFIEELLWDFNKFKSFIEYMINKYFKLNDFVLVDEMLR